MAVVHSSLVAHQDEQRLVKESIASLLRERIISGELQPGGRIVEGKWARELGVAQASVREAINILVSEGFLQKKAARSAAVTQLSWGDVVQMYQVRASLEGLAARLVAARGCDLSGLRDAVARMREAGEARNVRSIVECDTAFHLLLCRESGNPYLAEAARKLLLPLFAFTLIRALECHTGPDSWIHSLPEHERMVEAIGTGDAYFAEQYVARCVRGFVDTAAGHWAKKEAAASTLGPEKRGA